MTNLPTPTIRDGEPRGMFMCRFAAAVAALAFYRGRDCPRRAGEPMKPHHYGWLASMNGAMLIKHGHIEAGLLSLDKGFPHLFTPILICAPKEKD